MSDEREANAPMICGQIGAICGFDQLGFPELC